MAALSSVFADIALMSHVPPELRREIAGRLHVTHVGKGRTVLTRDAGGDDVFHVVEGTVCITLFSASGREISVNHVGAGEMFGEIAALDGQPRSASVVALSDLRLVRMSRADFLACLESAPAAGIWLAKRLATGVRRLTERVFEMTALNVQSRIHCELLRLAFASPEEDGRRIARPAPTHAVLATRVGTNREAVTRELGRLAENGVVRQGGHMIEFVDLGYLERAVARALG